MLLPELKREHDSTIIQLRSDIERLSNLLEHADKRIKQLEAECMQKTSQGDCDIVSVGRGAMMIVGIFVTGALFVLVALFV